MEWKEEITLHIRQQWGKVGLGLDYSRERFTLDEGLSDAVNKVFVQLYEKGLIYRGEYIINWDPATRTALSDIEVIHRSSRCILPYELSVNRRFRSHSPCYYLVQKRCLVI